MSLPPYPLKLPFDVPYFELDMELVQKADLKPEARVIYTTLCAYNGPTLQGYPLLEYLAADLSMPLVVVARHLTALKRAGLVK